MKIKLILLLWGIFVCQNVFSQWEVGFATGGTFNHLSTGSGYYYNRQYQGENSFSIALPVRYEINNWFSLGTEVSFLNKNYSWERIVPAESFTENTHVRNSYIQIPLMGQFSYGGTRLKGFTNLGVYFGRWINSHIKGESLSYNDGESYSFNESYQFNSDKDNRFEFGLLAGVGVKYLLTQKFTIFTELRYLYGLTDLQKDYMKNRFSQYNNTLQVQIGIMYKIK